MVYYKCRCDCGNVTTICQSVLSGAKRQKSCGCYARENPSHLIHGYAAKGKITPEYRLWTNMKKRCLSEGSRDSHNYGARGITIYGHWINDFASFLAYIGPRPTPQHTLDRKENNKGYEPGNVRWATSQEQNNNRRNNRRITIDGESKTMSQWARIVGIEPDTISARLSAGWADYDAIMTPLMFKNKFTKQQLSARRSEAQQRATPSWLTKEQRYLMRKMKRDAAKEGKHLDHVVPLRGRLAWGLHVPWNLAPLSPKENIAKGNRVPENRLA